MNVNPGDQITLPFTVTNDGNGPDRFDFRLARVTDAFGVDVIWDIDIPRESLQELSPGAWAFGVLMSVPTACQPASTPSCCKPSPKRSTPTPAAGHPHPRHSGVDHHRG